ncbi:MAG TPA: hypothetical protein VHY80_01295 [Stellaceae bacterium]|jgi:hypothetical protein|nr:hypothetical protein [Stellaceae bacterium]
MGDSVGFGTPITPTAAIDHWINPQTAVTPTQNRGEQAQASVIEEPTKLGLGTVISAVVRASAAQGPVEGTQLLLRVVTPTTTTPDVLTGVVYDSVGNETTLATPIGLLALQTKLALPAGTQIAFVVINTVAPEVEAAMAPARSGGWLALEETLFALTGAAPALADQLRAELTPPSGPDLAGTLIYLFGALYQGSWPAPGITRALRDSGNAKLNKRLADDIAALRRLGDDESTGEWRVLTLPLLLGNFPLTVRLYLQRRKPAGQDAIRFALEAELRRLGPVQLDCMVRANRLILVLRSHRALPPEIREEMRTVFQRALQACRVSGDLSFATVATFLVHPLDQMRERIEITA